MHLNALVHVQNALAHVENALVPGPACHDVPGQHSCHQQLCPGRRPHCDWSWHVTLCNTRHRVTRCHARLCHTLHMCTHTPLYTPGSVSDGHPHLGHNWHKNGAREGCGDFIYLYIQLTIFINHSIQSGDVCLTVPRHPLNDYYPFTFIKKHDEILTDGHWEHSETWKII